MKISNILLLGAIAIGGYLLYTRSTKGGGESSADLVAPLMPSDLQASASAIPYDKSVVSQLKGIQTGGVVPSYVPIADISFQEKGIAPVKSTVVAIGGAGQSLPSSSSGGTSSAKSSGLALKFAGSERVMPMSSGFAAKLASITKAGKK